MKYLIIVLDKYSFRHFPKGELAIPLENTQNKVTYTVIDWSSFQQHQEGSSLITVVIITMATKDVTDLVGLETVWVIEGTGTT